MKKITYKDLNSKQKELYNLTKLSAALIELNLTTIKLSDDYKGADFLMIDMDTADTFKVQLKSRITVDAKYLGHDLYIAFPIKTRGKEWVIVKHDELVKVWMKENTSKSWNSGKGYYSAGNVPGGIVDKVIKMSLVGILNT